MSFATCSQCQIHYCYTDRKVFVGAAQGELPEGQERVPWGIAVPRNSSARYYRQHYEDKLYQTSKFADAVRYNVPRIYAARLCRACAE